MPDVLDADVVPAFHCQPIKVTALALSAPALPRENPFELKAVTPPVPPGVVSASVVLLDKTKFAPRTESYKRLFVAELRAFTHTKSGWNEALFTVLAIVREAPVPV